VTANPARRALLRAAAAAVVAGPARVRAAAPRVLVVGGGWAALAALKVLAAADPAPAVTLLDRQPQFRCLPLSGAWLTGAGVERGPRLDLAAHAAARGARFVAAEVVQIDPARRQVGTADGQRFEADALLLATGCEADWGAWFGADAAAAAHARRSAAAGFAAHELEALRQRLAAFEGGDLLLTVPPAPLRCPPAPYERALQLAAMLRRRGLKARITLLDAGGGMPRLNRLFKDRWAGVIDHRLHVQVDRVDPFERRIHCSEGELRWDQALLLPPMHAGTLLRQAGLAGNGRWAAVDGRTLRSPQHAGVWLAGDALGDVSALFGPYPKTAQVALETGAAAAAQMLAALAAREAAPAPLPASECHVQLSVDPPELLQIDVSHRRRGDGEIVQAVRQTDNPQPRGEDEAWLQRAWARWVGG
jgi:NADPH-dependent 2,4-dienoyl-CoA reductase/sulfur reductase-like enzyme